MRIHSKTNGGTHEPVDVLIDVVKFDRGFIAVVAFTKKGLPCSFGVDFESTTVVAAEVLAMALDTGPTLLGLSKDINSDSPLLLLFALCTGWMGGDACLSCIWLFAFE